MGLGRRATEDRSFFRDISCLDDIQKQPQEIHFDDDDIEDAETITRFLHLVTKGHILWTSTGDCVDCAQNEDRSCSNIEPFEGEWEDAEDAIRLTRLASFLAKYNCQPWLDIMFQSLQRQTETCSSSPFDRFAAGAIIGRNDFCTSIVANWDPTRQPWKPGLDTRKWDLRQWRLVPSDYTWALTSAYNALLATGQFDGQTMASQFRARLERAQGELLCDLLTQKRLRKIIKTCSGGTSGRNRLLLQTQMSRIVGKITPRMDGAVTALDCQSSLSLY